MSEIKYSFTQMHQLGEDLANQLKVLRTQSETLESEIKSSLDSAWQSETAKGEYDSVQQRWNTEFADTQDILNRLIDAVHTSASNMQSRDRSVGNSFA